MGKTRKPSSHAYYRLTMSKKHQGINNNGKEKYIQGIVVLLFTSSRHVCHKKIIYILYKKTMPCKHT